MFLKERGLVPRCNGQTETVRQRSRGTGSKTPSAPDAELPANEEFGGIQFQRFRGAGSNAGAAAGALSRIEPGDFDPAGLCVGESFRSDSVVAGVVRYFLMIANILCLVLPLPK